MPLHNARIDNLPGYMNPLIVLATLGSLTLAAHASETKLQVGASHVYSAGPYDFHASPIAFAGRSLGHAASAPKPQRFRKDLWVYLACRIDKSEPDSDGECMQWKVLSTRTGALKNLKLPGFDSFTSTPSFSWPYVAYVEVGATRAHNRQDVYCVVYDYQTQAVKHRQLSQVPQDLLATDFPTAFLPPEIVTSKVQPKTLFRFHEDTNSSTLCELSIP